MCRIKAKSGSAYIIRFEGALGDSCDPLTHASSVCSVLLITAVDDLYFPSGTFIDCALTGLFPLAGCQLISIGDEGPTWDKSLISAVLLCLMFSQHVKKGATTSAGCRYDKVQITW